MQQAILTIDTAILKLLNREHTYDWLDSFAILLSSSYTWWIVALSIISICVIQKRKNVIRSVLLLMLAMGLSDLVCTWAIKPSIARERPCHQLSSVNPISGCGGLYGFPSNHASNGMAATSLLFFLGIPLGKVLLALAATILVALSRIYLGVHFLSDVLAGFGVGIFVSFLLFLVLKSKILTKVGKAN